MRDICVNTGENPLRKKSLYLGHIFFIIQYVQVRRFWLPNLGGLGIVLRCLLRHSLMLSNNDSGYAEQGIIPRTNKRPVSPCRITSEEVDSATLFTEIRTLYL